METFTVYLRIASDTLSAGDITALLGEPTGSWSIGESVGQTALRARVTAWRADLYTGDAIRFPDALMDALCKLGDEFANSLRSLVAAGAVSATLTVVQNLSYLVEDWRQLGISLYPETIAWLAAVRAGFEVDQYLEPLDADDA
jgi:hypothetical protein